MFSKSKCLRFPLPGNRRNASSTAGPAAGFDPPCLFASIVALRRILLLTALVVGSPGELRADDDAADPPIGIKVEDLDAGIEPQFERDILPLLKRSCLACHSGKFAESDVVLETPAAMLAYDGDEPLLVPGNPAAGKLLQVAAQLQEPFMPPEENDVGAKPLTPTELGQLKRWIELGAKAGDLSVAAPAIVWRPLPQSHRPIMAMQITERGDACIYARGNDLEIYDLRRGKLAERLVDPALGAIDHGFQDAAHLDMIHSLASCNEGEWIASGGFRTVKLWRHTRKSRAIDLPMSGITTALAVAAERGWIATGNGAGFLSLGALRPEASLGPLGPETDAALANSWQAHDSSIVALAFAGDGERLISVAAAGWVRCWEMPSGKLLGAWKLSTAPKLAEMIDDELLVTSSDDLVLRLWRLHLPTAAASDDNGEGTSKQNNETTTKDSAATADAAKEQVATLALEPAQQFNGHGRTITSLSKVSGAGRAFLSGSRDGFLRLWDVDTGAEKRQWIHGQAVAAVAASHDGTQMVSVGDDGVAKSWTIEQDEPQWAVDVDFQSARRRVRAEQTVEIAIANLEIAKKAMDAANQQQETDQKNLVAARGKLATAENALESAKATAKRTAARQTAASEAAKQADAMSTLAQRTSAALKEEVEQSQLNLAGIDQLLTLANQLKLGMGVQQQETGAESAALEPAVEAATAEVAPLQQAIDEVADSLQSLRQAKQQRVELDQKLQALLAAAKQEAVKATAQIETLTQESDKAKQAVAAAEGIRQEAEDLVRRADAGETSARSVVNEAGAEFAVAEQRLVDRRQALSQLRAAPPVRSKVVSASFSAAGEQLLLANGEGRLFLFHVDGSPIGAWQAATQGDLSSAHFAGSDEVVVVAQEPAQEPAPALVVWSTNGTWRLEQTLGGPNDPASPLVGRVLALDFSPDGRLLAIGGGDAARSGEVVIWNLAENRLHCQFDRPHDDVVLGLDFSRDGQYLATASADHMMKVFRAEDGTPVRSYEGHSHHVLDVAWRANGLQLATCSADKTIKIWDFRRGEQIRTIAGAGKEINAVQFLGNGSQLVSAAGDSTVRIHNADDGKQVRAISAGGDYLFCCAANESGDTVVAGGADRVLRVYNSADGTER